MKASLLDFLDSRLTKSAEKIYVKPNIPRDKAKNAIDSYAEYLTYHDIIVLIDESTFGNCKTGIIITNKEIVAKESFKPTIYREMMKIKTLEFKKGLISSSIIIDNEKCNLTQPNKENLQYLIEKCNDYLKLLSSDPNIEIEEAEQDPKISILESEFFTLKQNITQLEYKLKNKDNKINELESNLEYKSKEINKLKQEIENKSKEITKLKNEFNNKINNNSIQNYTIEKLEKEAYIPNHKNTEQKSLFTIIPERKDYLIEVTRKHLTATNVFINSIFTTSDTNELANIIKETICKIAIEIRENYIDKNNIIGLKNDYATIESLIYSTAIIKDELLALGMNARYLSALLNESLDEFLFVTQYPKNKNIVNIICASAFEEKPEKIQVDIYALRLYISNKLGTETPPKFEDILNLPILEEIMGKYVTEEVASTCNSLEELAFKVIRNFSYDVFKELGNLPFDQHIGKLKHNACHQVFKLAKQNNLI